MAAATYTLRGIQSMLGVSRAVLGALVDAGFVTPSRGKRGEYRFTFQDVVLLRTAHGLQQARIAPRRIVRSLQRLKQALPEEVPLTGLRIVAVGNEIAVQQADARWSVDSGQLLLDFEIREDAGAVSVLAQAPPQPEPARSSPQQWFERGVALEAVDRAGAEAAYRAALAGAPGWVDPALNLGVLLCDAGRCADAVAVYREALARCADEPLLHYNLAVALEDLGRDADALRHYETSVRLAPDFADAHYNAARLHERAGQPNQAIRHYSAYRRLQR